MLFLLKRRTSTSLIALAAMLVIAMASRQLTSGVPVLHATLPLVVIGVGVAACLVVIDGVLHALASWLFGAAYHKRFHELSDVFRRQSYSAMVAGAMIAGIGEELIFRGLGTSAWYLFGAAVVFGLLHHIRRSLWPFTLWSILEGCLFGLALILTGELAVTMVAHFLHDLIGFIVFKVERNKHLKELISLP
jgi:membrane protease YdiL (CAAX protease family)